MLQKVCTIQSVFEVIDTTVDADIALDQSTLSKVCIIESQLDNLDFDGSVVDDVLQKVCTIQSIVEVIDTKVDADIVLDQSTLSKVCIIESQLDNLDLDGSVIDEVLQKVCTIESTIDIIEDLDRTILSKVCVLDSKIDNINVEVSGLDEVLQKVCTIQSVVEVIDPRTVTIESTVDVIEEIDRTIVSKVCIINSQVDVIDTKLTDFIDTETNAFDGFVSVFGDKIAEGREDYINVAFQYGIPDIAVTSTAMGNGFVTTFSSMAVIRTSGAVGDEAAIVTKRNLRYRAGHEGYAFYTSAFTGDIAANTTQWIGLFDDENGAATGYNGTEFSVLFRSHSSDTIIAQSDFNRDKLDGTGPSGFTIDPTKLNVFRISYGWLGVAPYSFQVLSPSGEWILFHVIELPNTRTIPSVENPILPVKAEVSDPSGGNVLELRTASWNAGIIGSPSNAGHRYFSTSNQVIIAGTELHMLTLRNRSIYQGKNNRVEARIALFGGGSIQNANEITLLRLRQNATVTGTSFTDINTENSIMEVSTAGTFSAGTGFEILIRPSHTRGNGPGGEFIPEADFEIILLPGDTITITGESLSGSTAAIALISWEERF